MSERSSRMAVLEKLDIMLQCFELRKTGMSETEIAEMLSITEKQVAANVAKIVADKRKVASEYAQEQRELIMGRVDALISANWDEALAGNLFATDRVIRLNDQAIALSGAKVDKVDLTSGGKSLGELSGEAIKSAMDEAAKQVRDYEDKKRLAE